MKILKDPGKGQSTQSKQKLSKGSLAEWLVDSIWNTTKTWIK